MHELGRMERIDDLRTVWPHEANDFSKWLAMDDNLALLSDAVSLDIVLEERESAVGAFNVDIYALEESTGRKIIIENQLEDTDHDHLGKIITYASGKGAEVIIWIVKHARDEHKQAVEWLNQHTDENIGFFLVEIELWRINNSLPAPKFNVVERPNDWAKTMKTIEGLSDTKKLQLEFWQAFIDYAFKKEDFNSEFSKRKPQPQHWYDLGVGSSIYHINFTVNTQKNRIGTEIYISNDKDKFKKFVDCKEEIESALGLKLEWREAKKDCRILASYSGDIKTGTEAWPAYFDWMCKMALKFKAVIGKYGM
ncbi:MAG: DUF4268 domain-containing protein [Negativicutes bacterium]|nr:DUF4268 domain-containing protein [Negativicutes bacterium]